MPAFVCARPAYDRRLYAVLVYRLYYRPLSLPPSTAFLDASRECTRAFLEGSHWRRYCSEEEREKRLRALNGARVMPKGFKWRRPFLRRGLQAFNSSSASEPPSGVAKGTQRRVSLLDASSTHMVQRKCSAREAATSKIPSDLQDSAEHDPAAKAVLKLLRAVGQSTGSSPANGCPTLDEIPAKRRRIEIKGKSGRRCDMPK
eukprot:2456954-Pleurochrysis_carterae.AAC.2